MHSKHFALKLLILANCSLLFFPKFNVINVAKNGAGLRIDDIVIFLSFGILLAARILTLRKVAITKIECVLFLFGLLGFVSNIYNQIKFDTSNVLYSLRMIEYLHFVFIGYLYRKYYGDPWGLVKYFCYINCLVMLLQWLGLLGGFASEGYVSDVSTRVIGTTGGPWEIGVILNLYTAKLVYDAQRGCIPKATFYISYLFFLAFVVITGARMPLVAQLVLFLSYAFFAFGKIKFVSVSVSFSVILAFAVIFIPNPVTERSEKLISVENIEIFSEYYHKVDVSQAYGSYSATGDTNNADMSWLMRVSKWTYAIKYWLYGDLFQFFFGVGPGSWGVALDGGWLRMLTEYGLIGLLNYMFFWFLSFKLSGEYKFLFIPFFINMIMIDIFMAYKLVTVLYIVCGAGICKRLLHQRFNNIYMKELPYVK